MSAHIYLDLAEVPLDTWVDDEIDRPSAEKKIEVPITAPQKIVEPSGYIIPFKREIRLGSKGNDVLGAKRALNRALGLGLRGLTAEFGKTAEKRLRIFQEKHGLQVDGVLGPLTLKKLVPFFDAYSYLLYVGHAPEPNLEKVKRQAFVAYMLWGYNNRAQIHYEQFRPMRFLDTLHHLPVWEDCSEWYTKGAKHGGFPDPNGAHYNGTGWTGTLARHGWVVSDADIAPGDAVLYGPRPNFSHVAGYVGYGRVVSHGSEAGPLLLTLDYREIAECRTYLTR